MFIFWRLFFHKSLLYLIYTRFLYINQLFIKILSYAIFKVKEVPISCPRIGLSRARVRIPSLEIFLSKGGLTGGGGMPSRPNRSGDPPIRPNTCRAETGGGQKFALGFSRKKVRISFSVRSQKKNHLLVKVVFCKVGVISTSN